MILSVHKGKIQITVIQSKKISTTIRLQIEWCVAVWKVTDSYVRVVRVPVQTMGLDRGIEYGVGAWEMGLVAGPELVQLHPRP